MSQDFFKALQVAAAAAFMFGSTLESMAQEKSAPATNVASSSQPDGIAGAKKDFESIKASREAALQPKGELPRVSMPEWQGVPQPAPGIGGAQAKTPVPNTKSANWLIEAMDKQSGSHSARGQGDRGRDRDRSRDHDRDSGPMTRDRAGETKDGPDEHRSTESREEKGQDQKNTAGTVNPLSRYLGDWMTPQDYALLKPGLADSLVAGASGMAPTALTGVGSGGALMPLPGSNPGLESLALAKPAFASPAPRENPYLQPLANPDVATQIFAAKPKVTAPVPPPVPFLPPPMTAPPQSRVPEFAKPATDEKYFKPLKRF